MITLQSKSSTLVGWQKAVFEHGPTWSLVIGSIFLLFSLIPIFLEAKKYKRTFATSNSFFILWGIGSIFLTLNAVAYFFHDVVNQNKYEYMPILKHAFFGISNFIGALINFYSFWVKRKNTIEAEKLGISEEIYWETIVKKTLKTK